MLQAVVDDTGDATDELQTNVIKWLKDLGLPYTTMSEVMASGPDKKVRIF